MKKAIVIFLLFLVPWQATLATERNLTHVFGNGGHALPFVAQHLAEHAGFVLHHHDDDVGDNDSTVSGTHLDNSQKSVQHLCEYEHGSNLNMLFPTPFYLPTALLPLTLPTFIARTFTDRTTVPLLRPPRMPA